jgi:tetratricopeptide (TPR) repeat protein
MKVPLKLVLNEEADYESSAWFLPGADVHRWLDELSRSGFAEIGTRLFVVDKSSSCSSSSSSSLAAPKLPSEGGSSISGLLVVPHASRITQHGSGLACRSLLDRIYLPVDAELDPPVTNTELAELCTWEIAFFHPALGLIGFDEQSCLHLWDLLKPPDERVENWNFARHGPAPLPALSAILVARPPAMNEIFGGAEKEIGSEPITDLPRAPDEPRDDRFSKSRRDLERLIARAVEQAMKLFPKVGSGAGWAGKVQSWAQRQLNRVDEQLQRLRNKELHRLLSMLDNDPEAGLRHAVPLNSFPHRGIAPPGGRLGMRSLNFDPRRLGGGPADFWHVPFDLQEALRRRYREMGDREMQLGRYRRAAYIYAELLGDLVSSAHALKQGRLFREAAVLYEEQLHNPLEAARCLAEGGLLAEAIERYEKMGRWLEAADLYERLGNQTAADAAVRRVVNDCLAQEDLMGAAKLVEERLRSPDEAIDLLRQAWPNSRQAAASIGALFRLWGRLGRHDAAIARLAQFTQEPVAPALSLPLLGSLAGPLRDYPDARVRHDAADFSRVLIARQLDRPGLAVSDAERLMEYLLRSAPEDRLLARDTHRHLADRRQAELQASRARAATDAVGRKPVVVRRIELPRPIQWLHLRAEANWFFALGVTPMRLTLLRGIWDGQFQSLSWGCDTESIREGLLLFETMADRGKTIALTVPYAGPLPKKVFPATDLFFGQETVVATPAWLTTDRGWIFAVAEEAIWSASSAEGRWIISSHDKHGHLQRTLDVTTDLLEMTQHKHGAHLSLVALAQGVAVAFGNRLLVTQPDGTMARIELPGQSMCLRPTLPHTRQGVAVMLEHGAAMYWRGSGELLELERDLPAPLACFVPGGPLVLISGTQGALLEVDARGVHGATRFDTDVPDPTGLCSTGTPGQFAILGNKGQLVVFQAPR